ncbi:MmcQ/YjbR family DNA-binding protein [Bradyrhizobium sp. WSM 1704]|uniref:MmcQ/YjbR family DNA-binding protein n=1 Tax=Bradyrhizobium semiaridum TaxID=2821404 RepID=UPI001CE26A78|nr:MmcQ/YjbR family DNA-binding protein [Bradyrhizobium semiaridum]MCA6120837.1 MmcQ/YjbR family DNA-binding protein [Bradyrhizobium semiaridum]
MSQARFRKIALACPEAIEGGYQGLADFRVGRRIFATLGYPNEAWGMVKLTPEQQAMVVAAEPEIFRPAPNSWGKRGSTNVRLAKTDVTTLRSVLKMVWSNVTAKPARTARRTSS